MNYLDRLLWALAQKFVDLTQRKPIWLAHLAAEIMMVALVCNAWTEHGTPGFYVLLFFMLTNGTIMVYLTHNTLAWDVLRKLAHVPWMRALRWSFLILAVVGWFSWADAFDAIADLMQLSIYYLAMCDDPKPKQPRTSAVPQT